MDRIDPTLLLQTSILVQAAIAFLFGSILHHYTYRRGAPAGLCCWAVGQFALAAYQLGSLGMISGTPKLWVSVLTIAGAWIHVTALTLGTLEFARRRAVPRSLLYRSLLLAALVGIALVLVSAQVESSAARMVLRPGLRSLAVIVACAWSIAILLRHVPRPMPFGGWLFVGGLAAYALQSAHYFAQLGLAPLLGREPTELTIYLGMLDPCIHCALGSGMVILLLDRAWSSALNNAEQVRHARRLESVGTLASGIAHEYNNLLTTVIGHADFLADTVQKDPAALGDVEAIRAAVDRATELNRQLLAFSRAQELRPLQEDCGAILREMRRAIEKAAGDHVEVQWTVEPDLPPVVLDRAQFELTLMNLAVNSREALEHGGKLHVHAHWMDYTPEEHSILRLKGGRYVVVRFQDNGPGMDEETLERALEPFFSTKDEIQAPTGFLPGLGLSSVYGFVRQSGGDVLLESTQGEGTSVSLYLPTGLLPADLEPVEPLPHPPEAAPVSRTILLVEDDRAVAEMSARALQGAGHRVITAQNGVDALMLASQCQGRIDLLVTDLLMPGMSGQALRRALSAEHGDVPCLYMSGYSGQDLRERGLEGPRSGTLAKPFTPDQLRESVGIILHGIRERAER